MQVKTISELGSAIRTTRRTLGLTQEVAAALCGVSMPFLNQLEGGKRQHLSTSKVLAVCAGPGVRVVVSGSGMEDEARRSKDR